MPDIEDVVWLPRCSFAAVTIRRKIRQVSLCLPLLSQKQGFLTPTHSWLRSWRSSLDWRILRKLDVRLHSQLGSIHDDRRIIAVLIMIRTLRTNHHRHRTSNMYCTRVCANEPAVVR